MVVFCFGPLPDERAFVRITSVKRSYAVGEMQRLVVESPLRAEPFCKVFGTCGGCQIQHLAYPAQLAWKHRVVRDALARIGGMGDIDVRQPIGMTVPRAYRNKMALVLRAASRHRPAQDGQSSGSVVGFYRQRSHEVVPIDECPIVMRQLDELIPSIKAASIDPQTAGAFASARHVLARAARGNDGVVVTVTTAKPSESLGRTGAQLLSQLKGAAGLVNSFDLAGDNAVVGRKFRRIAGDDEIEEDIAGIRYRISAASFFQINTEILAGIFDFLRPALAPANVIDLYCGAGTFALFFAKHGCAVYGIEESAAAVGEAESNARRNRLDGLCRFRPGPAENVLRQPEAQRALAAAQIAFLDPPRKGSDEATLGALAAAEVPQIWYLSCDPATLARDLKFLAAKGYRIAVVQPFDMFPQTGHVETFVALTRQKKEFLEFGVREN
jgi:23S rRNA (uracil1939-C5)-methyltransferase